MTGLRFHFYEVIKCAGKNAIGAYQWHCKCDCGNERIVVGADLRRGHSKSCGCHQRQRASEANQTHGATLKKRPSHEYISWMNMISRCENRSHPRYSDYGGRGISICTAWRESFSQFLADMGPKPTKNHSIERIDNDKNYEPGNCRWATDAEQARNTRKALLCTFNGVTKPLRDFADELGMSYNALRARKTNGWSDEELLTIPVSKHTKVRNYRVVKAIPEQPRRPVF